MKPRVPRPGFAANLSAKLLDAWVGYAVDPKRWEQLLEELETHAGELGSIEPNEFLAAFSSAEALSWRIRTDEVDRPGGFAYALVDAKDQRVVVSDEGHLLSAFLEDSEDSTAPLRFVSAQTQKAWSAFCQRPGATDRHELLELRDAQGELVRYGYVVTRGAFPSSLAALGQRGERALLVPETTTNPALRRTLRASFSLTDAEVDLTLLLAEGRSLKEIAEHLEISINTARNQLQSVFAKTRISRQSELLLVVTQLGILVATDRGPSVPLAEDDAPPLEILALPDGRQLAYRRYGAETGRPVLFMHASFFSSRLPAGTHQWAMARNLQIVASDRAGSGFSSAPSEASFAAIAADHRVLLQWLGWREVLICGYLSGAGFALELAHDAGVVVDRVMLIAGRSPKDRAAINGNRVLDRVRRLFGQQHWLLNSFFNILRNRANPGLYARLIQRAYGTNPMDQALFDERPDVLEHCVRSCIDCQSVSAAGVVVDMRAYLAGSDRDPRTLRCGMTVWHGDADVVASPEHLRDYLADCDVHYRVFAGEGSMLFYRHFEAVLDELARDLVNQQP